MQTTVREAILLVGLLVMALFSCIGFKECQDAGYRLGYQKGQDYLYLNNPCLTNSNPNTKSH